MHFRTLNIIIMEAKYWIAQLIDDLFRNEPRNVGVFVQIGDQIAAKFLGESEGGEIDGRRLKTLSYPNVYRQWVQYWRRLVATNQLDQLVLTSGSHYRVIEAGNVTDIESDSPYDVAGFLYATLVSPFGYASAISDLSETEPGILALDNEVITTFKQFNILDPEAKHPIRQDAIIQGKKLSHKPSYVQENGKLYIMETVDFTLTQKARSKDHAGYSAYMFKDIKENKANAEPISIVKVNNEDMEYEDVILGLNFLKNESQVVNWFDINLRNAFIEKCRAIAYT
jgi:hypothetical protein